MTCNVLIGMLNSLNPTSSLCERLTMKIASTESGAMIAHTPNAIMNEFM